MSLQRNCLFALILVAPVVAATPLRSPWDAHPVPLTDAAYNCPAPPPFAKSLDAESYYIDAHHSIIDPVKKKAFEEATAAPTHLGQWVGLAADAYLTHGSRAAANCAYALLTDAADADAWTAAMPTAQATYSQKWMLSGTAMAYLKVRDSGVGTPEQDRKIQQWFEKVAGRLRDYVEGKRRSPNSDAWNNHLYWAGLAVAAAGVAANNTSDFRWGLNAYKDGVNEIEPSGALPRELARAGMALHYHLYALAPLVMIAELAEANGQDLYPENHNALERLVRLSTAGLLDPGIFTKVTGVQQEMPDQISGALIGWAVPYLAHHPDPQLAATLQKLVAQASTTRFWQWGGLPPDSPEVMTNSAGAPAGH